MKLCTWNINSVRLRIDLIKRFMELHNPDILCLQETKCANDQFPLKAIKALGFDYIELQGQKAYHGVATLSRIPIKRLKSNDYNGTEQARHLAVTIETSVKKQKPLILHNFYVPSGGDEPDVKTNIKFKQKLEYLTAMEKDFFAYRNKQKNRMILVGDLNIAPLENDVWSHKQLLKVVSHTPIEVEHMQRLQKSHQWVDAMRKFYPEDKKLYTWWSYRAKDWQTSNRGRRLDHVWVTPALDETVRHMQVVEKARGWEKASDHAPVIVDFDLEAQVEL